MEKPKYAMAHFRKLATREIVHSFKVPLPCSPRQLERIEMGALFNMSPDCFLDTTEVQDAQEP